MWSEGLAKCGSYVHNAKAAGRELPALKLAAPNEVVATAVADAEEAAAAKAFASEFD